MSFFVATLGAQVALVAGARAASLVAARWRNDIVAKSERELVRVSAVIGVAALAISAISWSVAVFFAYDRGHSARPATVIAGALVMMSAASIALAMLARPSATNDDHASLPPPGSTSPRLSVGERTIDHIRRHPSLACTAAAIIGAAAAMSHAETTIAGALLWGAIEATAIVAGFIVLGPRLSLRATPPQRIEP